MRSPAYSNCRTLTYLGILSAAPPRTRKSYAMSLRASVAIRLKLPRRLWADRASDVLAALAVCAVGWVSARHGSAAWACGLSAVTAVLMFLARVRAPLGGPIEAVPGSRTRRLGSTLVVEGPRRPSGESGVQAWLTPWDLPTESIRRLSVRLWAESPKAGS